MLQVNEKIVFTMQPFSLGSFFTLYVYEADGVGLNNNRKLPTRWSRKLIFQI